MRLPKHQKLKNFFYRLKHGKKRFVFAHGVDFGVFEKNYITLALHDRKTNHYYVIDSQVVDKENDKQ